MKNEILIIEDVPEMSQLICMYLENSGFSTTACENAEAALEKLSTGYLPDLVLLDLNLPGMSGFDFLKKFRGEYKASIPVIIVSARDADEDIIAGLGFGRICYKAVQSQSSCGKGTGKTQQTERNRGYSRRNAPVWPVHAFLQQLRT